MMIVKVSDKCRIRVEAKEPPHCDVKWGELSWMSIEDAPTSEDRHLRRDVAIRELEQWVIEHSQVES